MASNFFPMLSSSPPPIDDTDYFEDDDDDEFGAFKGADGTLECSSSFDIPDRNESPGSHIPELRGTRSSDTRRNVCSENGINGEISVFQDCNLLHKKEKICRCQDVAVGYCSCDNCVFTEALDTKLTLVDHHLDSAEGVDGEGIRFRRHSVDLKKTENLGKYSGETATARLGSQDSFYETSLHSGDSQSRTKDIDSSHEHSLDSSFINCTSDLSPKLLHSQREISPVSSIDDGLPPDLCDDTNVEPSVISGTVSRSLLHEKISRTSNSLDDVSSDNVDKDISEEAASDNEDYQSKFTLFSSKQDELFVDGEISKTVIDSPSLNLSGDVQSFNSESLAGRRKDHLEDQTSTCDSENLQETDVYYSRIPVLDHLSSKLSRVPDNHSLIHTSNGDAVHDFVSEETFSRGLAETPDEFDDFQQADFVHCDQPTSEGNGVYCEIDSFSDTTGEEYGDVKYSAGAFSHSVPSQEHENYQAQCSAKTSASERSAGDFRTEDPLSTSGFADFESATFDHQNEMPSESVDTSVEDSFADFESAASLKAHNILEPHSLKSSKDSDKGIGKISAVISAIFPVSEDAAPSGIVEEKREIWEHNPKSNRLWDKLHEIEQTPGLRFQWGVSHSFQLLLRSVNVDYHSILRTSSVPFFASGLSLLEPTKGPVQSAAKVESEEKFQSRKDLAIPPVQFDWSSSGLVNPLDSTQATSTLMDLSFLSSTESNSSHLHMSSDFGLESEFLQPCCPASPTESNTKPPILQQLLSSTAVSSLPDSSQSYRPSSMSQEAIHVLDQLPDLSFMRAKVLMFPVSSNT